MLDLNSLLQTTIDRQASDLHLISGYFPTIRINNELFPLKTEEVCTRENMEQMIYSILNAGQKENLLANKEFDFSYALGDARFRVNAYNTKNELSAAFRYIPSVIRSIDDLLLPPVFHDFSKINSGLILLTGPTGEGKSTSLASIINEINLNSSKHIITIEDPIEFVYPKARSIVSQRELHNDTISWNMSLRSVLREDPDVVLVGEMRDYETIQAVLSIAETGHLVFSTLHTISTPEAINRIIDVFPPNQTNQIRNQLAAVLRAVVAQRLLPDIENKKRIPAFEILLNIPAVSSMIREGKNYMLDNILETEEGQGMFIFEKYIAKLYRKGDISKDTALQSAIRPNEIKKFL